LVVLRPSDANEVAEAWRYVIGLQHEPVVLILSRQNMATVDRTKYAPASGVTKGAYVLSEAPGGKPDVLLIGTGSEVGLCISAQDALKAKGINARVVSMPSWELFERQDAAYRESVIPSDLHARVTVEQASTFGWERYAGLRGCSVGMVSYGASAPLKDLQKKFGFTLENVVAKAEESIKRASAK
jgi:transketolase